MLERQAGGWASIGGKSGAAGGVCTGKRHPGEKPYQRSPGPAPGSKWTGGSSFQGQEGPRQEEAILGGDRISCSGMRPMWRAEEDASPDADRSHRYLKTTHFVLCPDPGTKQQRSRSFPKSPQCCSDTGGGGLPPSAPISPAPPPLSPASLSIARRVYCVPTMCRLASNTALARGAAGTPWSVLCGRPAQMLAQMWLHPHPLGNERYQSNPVGVGLWLGIPHPNGEGNERVVKDAEIRRG